MTDKVRVITEEQYEEYMKLKEMYETNRNADLPKAGEVYWSIDADGDLFTDVWENTDTDKQRKEIGNVFKTAKEAQKEIDRLCAYQELLDMCDWDGGVFYEICYNVDTGSFDYDYHASIYHSPYLFSGAISAQKAIYALGTEKLKLIFGID